MTIGLLLTAFVLGLRHGVDWDHIAAIGDLSGSAADRRRGFWLSFLYAAGHAVVVFALGAVLMVAGASIPDSLDAAMGYVVGLSLVALGFWVLVSLARHGRDFRLRSRWILVLDGTFAGCRRVRRPSGRREIRVDHEHGHEHGAEPHEESFAHDHGHVEVGIEVDEPVGSATVRTGGHAWEHLHAHQSHHHAHRHRHTLVLPSSAEGRYGPGTAAAVGMLHGVGIESPTQMAVFVASTSVVGSAAGLTLLGVWVIGLIVANTVLAVVAGIGLLGAERSFKVYASLAVLLAIVSIVVGAGYLTGSALPAINP